MKKTKIRIPSMLLLVVINIFFVCLYLWWHGFLPEVGKTIDEPYDMSTIKWPEPPVLFPEEDFLVDFKKTVPKMTTRALVETFIETTNWSNPGPYHYIDDIDLKLSKLNRDDVLLNELLQRNNAGRVLLQAYRGLPTSSEGEFKLYSNRGSIGNLELLLTAEKIRCHLTPKEKASLQEVADQKQQEKFSDYFYSDAEYNYLYKDTYGENNLGNLEWFEEKVKARAKPFENLRLPIFMGVLWVNSISFAVLPDSSGNFN